MTSSIPLPSPRMGGQNEAGRIHPPGWALLLLVLAAWCLSAAPGYAAERVSILYFNDFHSQIEPREGGDGPPGGLAHLAGAVKIVRERVPATLLLNAGDFVQGTPYFNAFGGQVEIEAMNILGVDAAVLGNHEFDNGTRFMAEMVAPARFPVLSANILVPDTLGIERLQIPEVLPVSGVSRFMSWIATDEERAQHTAPGMVRPALPYAIYQLGETRIAVVGLTTESIANLVISTSNPGITAEPVAEAARRWVERLRPQVDLMVVLSHSGLGPDSLLAVTVPGIDVIVGGHDHRRLPGPRLISNQNRNGIAGTLLVEAGSRGQFLGHLELEMRKNRILSYAGRLLPVGPKIPPDPEMLELVEHYRERLGDELGEVIASAPRGMSSQGAREQSTPLGVFVSEVMRRAAEADIGFQNSGALRASIRPGPVTMSDAYRVLPFENNIMRCVMTGDEVFELLSFAIVQSGEGGYPQLAGVELRVEDGVLREVAVGGLPLEPGRDYVVATNNYLFHGGDGYTQFARAREAADTGIAVRDAFVEAAREAGELTPEGIPVPAR